MPELSGDPWFELATRLRQARFYLRFLDPEYRGMPALLARTRSRAPRAGDPPRGDAAARPGRTAAAGARARRPGARDGHVDRFHAIWSELAPDVVVMTPLVVLKTSQLDLARAAIERGVRNVFAVASWDNLSSKGELTFAPQRVVVWNEVQKQEAIGAARRARRANRGHRRPGVRRVVRRRRRPPPARHFAPGSACAPTGRSCFTSVRRCSKAARPKPGS